MGMSDADSRYLMRSKNRLPKFDSEKNPFAHTTKPEFPKVVGSVCAPTKIEPAAIEAGALFDQEAEETKLATGNEAVPVALPAEKIELKAAPVSITVPVTRKTNSTRMKDFFKKMNPLPQLAVLKVGGKTKAHKPVRTHVQTELSLEKVKPVRNDLSDSDLEVVSPKRAQLPKGPQPYLKPLTKTEPTTWNRLTSRFFGPTEVR
ncbi:hypothetical protein Cflav_PD3406 [Pedosphaera parvula Ellin514]|uniref:Uncharacterized protein n=2 Tax=Pedosphaera TaxID=1032526 RepID=B9XIH5_PEDPL|nr:hypothetical protein Cflav_PD3406 [Pedosphaera parvula Ellin514]